MMRPFFKYLIIFSFTFLIFPQFIFSQNIIYSTIQKNDKRNLYFEIIGKVSENFVVYKKKSGDHILAFYDAAMQLTKEIKMVDIPDKPYTTLREAILNWQKVLFWKDIETYLNDDGDLVLKGYYLEYPADQEFLFEQLAPVLRNTVIEVLQADYLRYLWIIENGKFRTISLNLKPIDDSEDSDDEDCYDDDNLRLSGFYYQ